MPGPKTKSWSALENKHKPSGLHVIVSGLVEMEPDQAPVLTERTGRPNMLELELTIGTSKDPDFDAKVWKQAMFHKEVKANQYNSVRVMWDDFVVADFPVIDDRERSKMMEKQAAAQNAVVGKASYGKQKKTTAKKVVKKAVEAVKDAVDTVTSAAKKLAKTVSKKAPKKAAKKAAKKQSKKTARKTAGRTSKRPAKKVRKAKAARRPARKAKRR